MAKLGYTWYPKDWRSSMNVSQLTLQEKGFYRELIDECFIQSSDKIMLNCKTFTRINQLNSRSFTRLLAKLHESLLIVCPNFDKTLTEVEILIPSVSYRLGVIESAVNGGKSGSRKGVKKVTKLKDKLKDKDKEFPSLLEFLEYCKTIKEYPFEDYEFAYKSKYEAWESNDWKDGNDNKIKNWKSKIKNTIPYLNPIKQKTNSITQNWGMGQ